MRDDLSPVLGTLDGPGEPITCFIRDDDAGWDDARLLALVDVTVSAGVPMDLAAIPLALSDGLARRLSERIDAAPTLLGIHQHGLRHVDHETSGRKCEFGAQRSRDDQHADLTTGRDLLLERFGRQLDPIFTPPWNRCASHTPELLHGLGFRALSRDRTAAAQHRIPELSVDVDWCKHVRLGGIDAAARALADALCARAADRQPLGLMLHHAAMDASEFAVLRRWLAVLARHPRLDWCPMRALVDRIAPRRRHENHHV